MSKFFPEKRKLVKVKKETLSKTLEPPSRENLHNFFKSVLCDFNNFQALNGFFKQIEGFSMGSKLSPSLANIFCSMFENDIIESELENKNIIGYWRYVDDILVLIKKGQKNQLLQKLDKFDSNLKFTIESMENSKITFLDTSISLLDGKLNLNMFRNPESSDNVVNFKKSISPKGYKWSNLIGEIHRCNNTTSNNYFRDEALEKTKNIF